MEADSANAFRQGAQLFTNAILKAATGMLFPSEADVSGDCIVLGGNSAQNRARILEELRKINYAPKEDEKGTLKDLSNSERIDLVVEVAKNMSFGFDRFFADQTDVEEYPAWEFSKMYDREDPEDDWPDRWRAAAEAAGDGGALNVLEATGRMVALKSSGVWQALGDGIGGYDDALGNPWPPFAVESGFDIDGVPHNECVKELRLLKHGETAKPATIPSPDEIVKRFVVKFDQYLTTASEEEKKRRDDPLTFGTSDELLDLACDKLDTSGEFTSEQIAEIKSLVSLAIERGAGEDDERVKEIYETIDHPQKTAAEIQAERVRLYGEGYFLVESAENLFASAQELKPEISKQLFDTIAMAFEKGVGSQFNLRARAHKLLMKIFDRTGEKEKAKINCKQYIENASGFMLLNDAQIQLKNLGKQMELEAGAKLLDMLTQAVKTIPENESDKHAEAYRATAEVLEAIGDIQHAIEYFEFALQKNPNISVKRRLSALRKKISNPPT